MFIFTSFLHAAGNKDENPSVLGGPQNQKPQNDIQYIFTHIFTSFPHAAAGTKDASLSVPGRPQNLKPQNDLMPAPAQMGSAHAENRQTLVSGDGTR